MKCTVKNIILLFGYILENHADNQRGADFAEFDDENDMLHAVEDGIEFLEIMAPDKIEKPEEE